MSFRTPASRFPQPGIPSPRQGTSIAKKAGAFLGSCVLKPRSTIHDPRQIEPKPEGDDAGYLVSRPRLFWTLRQDRRNPHKAVFLPAGAAGSSAGQRRVEDG